MEQNLTEDAHVHVTVHSTDEHAIRANMPYVQSGFAKADNAPCNARACVHSPTQDGHACWLEQYMYQYNIGWAAS